MIREFETLDGALLVDKTAGPTSHDVVDLIRRQFGIQKAGHCGTLDPNATGLLILVLGRATKLSERLMSSDKVYQGVACLGITTDSYDVDGRVTATHPVLPLTLEQLNHLAADFQGDQIQTPPMVSAVKIDGVPLYKLARKGVEVERKGRLIHVYSFHFKSYEEPLGHFQIACTKGTYVRSLVHDLGQKIGCGAHLASLRRIASGPFQVAHAIPLDQLKAMTPAEMSKQVIPFHRLVEVAAQ